MQTADNTSTASWIETQRLSHTFEKRFWGKVNKLDENSCWNWTGGLDSYGYGSLHRGKKSGGNITASKLSWFIHNGDFDQSLCVLHKCDNPKCCNPNHLFIGTQQQNMADCAAKQRGAFKKHPELIRKGTKHHNAKLTETEVVQIRALKSAGKTCEEIATQFMVCPMTISLVSRKVGWRHID